MRRAPRVALDPVQRQQISGLVHTPGPRQRVAMRAAVVLRAADGHSNRAIAEELGTTTESVSRWRRRFLAHGVGGIVEDAPRSGRPKTVDDAPIHTRNFLLRLNEVLEIQGAAEILPPADMPKPAYGLVLGFENIRPFIWLKLFQAVGFRTET